MPGDPAGNRYGLSTSTDYVTGGVFEPFDSRKGDMARTYFYAVARWSEATTWTNDYGYKVFSDNGNNGFVQNYLDMLLKWHKLDPVDEFEIHRNNLLYNNYTNNRNIETVETQLLQNPHFTPIMPSNAETHQNNAIPYAPFPLNNEIYPNQTIQNLINPNNINQNQDLANTYNIVNLPNKSILDQPQYIANNNNKGFPYSTASYEPDTNALDYQTRASIDIDNLESYVNNPPIDRAPQKTLITTGYSVPKRVQRLKTTIIVPKKKTIIIPKKTVVIVPKAENTLLNIQNNPVIQSQYVPQIVSNSLITVNNNLVLTPLSPSLIPVNNAYSTLTMPGLSRTSQFVLL
jgi:hypothetical protein